MSRSNEVGGVELGFGDVLQFGKQIPGSDEIAWDPGIQVVLGPTVHESAHDLSAWPVILKDDNKPYIDMTGTLSAAHLRRYGTLTVEEVSVLLRRGWEHSKLAAKHGVESIVQNYVADEPRPRRRYDFILHEVGPPSFEDTMQLLKDMRANQDYWLNQ